MKFYIGLYRLPHIRHFENSFISVNQLRNRKSPFVVNNWIMDSGAFTEISTFGHYRFSEEDYASQINKWATCGNLELAVSQDYMCEPFMLAKTGLNIIQHQSLTINRYDNLVNLCNVTIMPVLQGYTPEDYCHHLDMYGERLNYNQRVGVGSICKRNSNPKEIIKILESINHKRPDLRLHGFGLKITSLKNAYITSLLYSADSMAWSYAARREGRDANSLQEALNFYNNITNQQGTKPFQKEFAMRCNI
uniref:DeoxyPurine in DNA protein A domain-containing protein n=1 Tax=viral metagenome TaxID=1070528 RepID=A0A6M3LD30_9ZZZZ